MAPTFPFRIQLYLVPFINLWLPFSQKECFPAKRTYQERESHSQGDLESLFVCLDWAHTWHLHLDALDERGWQCWIFKSRPWLLEAMHEKVISLVKLVCSFCACLMLDQPFPLQPAQSICPSSFLSITSLAIIFLGQQWFIPCLMGKLWLGGWWRERWHLLARLTLCLAALSLI